MVNLGTLTVARDGALSAVRPVLDRALGRFSAGIWPVVQSALAAGLAWYAAMLVLGHDRPFVAAIAAVISVGAVAGQTMRRAAEWMLGVAVGLAVAGLVVVAIGTGPVQTGVMVGLAMGVALLIRGGIMFWTEVGVSAILVSGLDPTTQGVSPDRFVEALVGCGVALAVSAAFPSNPSLRVRKAARPVLGDLATVYRDVAAAFIGGDLELSQRALAEARQIDARVSQLLEELDGGYQIARYAPPRMRQLGPMSHYANTADHLDLAVRDTRVLARAAVTLVSEKRAAPGSLVEARLELAHAVEALAGYQDKPDQLLDAPVIALGAAKEATSALETSNDVETSALVGQIRATALDLLQATGMDPSEALEALRETSRR
jgi:uncharacterized membrane protein YccC